jgi:hypothetical protein
MWAFIIIFLRASCPVNPIHGLLTVIIFCDEYILWSFIFFLVFPIGLFLHSYWFSTLLSDTLSLCSFLNLTDSVLSQDTRILCDNISLKIFNLFFKSCRIYITLLRRHETWI